MAGGDDARRERLKAALRENLKRRKARAQPPPRGRPPGSSEPGDAKPSGREADEDGTPDA